MWRLFLLLGLITAVPVAAQPGITIGQGSTKLHLPMPDGYCTIDTERARESSLFERQAGLMLPRQKLLALAIDCSELQAFRDRHRAFTRYLAFTTLLQDEKPVLVADPARAGYLADFAARSPHFDLKPPADPANKRPRPSDALVDARQMAVIDQDESAIYFGHVVVIKDVKAVDVVAVVTAVGGQAVSAEFRQPFGDDHSIEGLLDVARREAPALIAANIPAPPRVFDPDPPAVAAASSGLNLGGIFNAKIVDELTEKLGRTGMIAAAMAACLMFFTIVFLMMTRSSR